MNDKLLTIEDLQDLLPNLDKYEGLDYAKQLLATMKRETKLREALEELLKAEIAYIHDTYGADSQEAESIKDWEPHVKARDALKENPSE